MWTTGRRRQCAFLKIIMAISAIIVATSSSSSSSDDDWETYLASLESVLERADTPAWSVAPHAASMVEENPKILSLYIETESLQHQVDAGIRQYNEKVVMAHVIEPMDSLSSKMSDYAEVQEAAQELAADLYTLNETYATALEGLVTLADLKKQLDYEKILKKVDKGVESNVRAALEDSVGSIALDLPEKLGLMESLFEDFDADEAVLRAVEKSKASNVASEAKATTTSNAAATSSCPSIPDVVKEIQNALVRHHMDGIGVVDRLQSNDETTAAASRIVHEKTSETYWRPPEESDLVKYQWWRRYVPSDIAHLLPGDWENWDARQMIPAPVWQSLIGLTTTHDVLPPEVLLSTSTMPGHCWAMDGSKGHVTIAIGKTPASQQGVQVQAISIDHVSAMLVESRTSAPRSIRVVGYPPCSKGSDCQGLEFDPSRSVTLIEDASYELDGSATQTFLVADDEGEGGASCSATTASCGTEPPLTKTSGIAAITVFVDDNWGQEDYTCLYRVRVHGESSA